MEASGDDQLLRVGYTRPAAPFFFGKDPSSSSQADRTNLTTSYKMSDPLARSPSTHNPDAAQLDDGNSLDETERRRPSTPLPKMQLFVLCLMRTTEPMSYTVIFPFVSQMLHENLPDVPINQLGYYAGLVESTFAFVQFMTIFFWGRLSDRIGRKPVLLFGLLGTFLSVNCFGLAKSLPAMIIARSISGLMNGNIAVLKSVLAEITDETNQARAFSLIPMCFAVGSIVGSSIGGYLAHPAETFPNLFGDWQFFIDNPFYLPCAVTSMLNLAAILLGTLFLKETLPKKTKSMSSAAGQRDDRDEEQQPLVPAAVPKEELKRPPLRSLLTVQIRRILGTQFCLNFMNACHAALLPLFCYETIANGGLGFSNADIGNVLAVNGIFTILVQVVVFPSLERRLGGPLRVYQRVTMFLPLVWICLPLAHILARKTSGKTGPILAIAAAIVFKGTSNMSIVCSNLLVNNSAPTRSSLGALNGISQMCGSLSRTIGPTFSTSLFAFSTSRHLLDGQLSWLVMWTISAATWLLTLRVQAPAVAPWRQQSHAA